jgi:2-dehydropantoate 2-reductase
MRIAVVGAGGFGGYFGGLLARGGADVHFIARGAHLQALQTRGLRVEGGAEPFELPRVSATADPGDVGPVDLVMICVKLWDTESALAQIGPLVGPDTAIVSFQNGVLKDRYLVSAFGGERVIGGVGYVASTISAPGVISRTGTLERLVVGELGGGRSARVEALREAALDGGINVEVSDAIQSDIWQKFVFLVGLSAATTTMRVPIGAIRANAQTRAFLLDLMREVVAVGRASDIPLADDYAEQRLVFVDGVAAEMTSSMHHDLEARRPLEVRWLSGAVVELGEQVGVPTPLNRSVADILHLRAAGQ